MENGQESSRDFAQSSGESEYCAIGSGAADALYAKAVMTEIGLEVQAVVLSDSSSGRGFAKRQGFSARTRHVKCVCVCVCVCFRGRWMRSSRMKMMTAKQRRKKTANTTKQFQIFSCGHSAPVLDEASARNTTAEQQEETKQKTQQSSFTVRSGSVGVPAGKA